MSFYLLDVAAPALLLLPLLAFMVVCGLLEGLIIYIFKIRKYWTAVGHALLVNIVSLMAGFLVLPFFNNYDNDRVALIKFLSITFIVTVIIEGILLKVLNKKIFWKSIFAAAIIMNLLTYIILYLIIKAG